MKVLVTGATGHLGRQLVANLLLAGDEVVAVSRSGELPVPHGSAPSLDKLSALSVDLSDEASVLALRPHLGPEVAVVHLAASRPNRATDANDRSQLFEHNVLGTLRLLDAARRSAAGALAVIYACDASVYESSPEAVDEEAFLRPATDYAATKLSGEDHLFAFEFEEQTRCVSLRFGSLYGPGRRSPDSFSSLLASCASGAPIKVVGHPEQVQARIHVSDAARAIQLALAGEVSGRFNIADNSPQPLRLEVETLLQVCKQEGAPVFEAPSGPAARFELDTRRARDELGFLPRFSLADAFAEEWRVLRGEA